MPRPRPRAPLASLLALAACVVLAACDPKPPTDRGREATPAVDASGASEADTSAGEAVRGEAGPNANADESTGASTTDNPGPPASESVTLGVDRERSKVGLFVARATTGHVAEFDRFDGRIELAGEVPQRLEIEVELSSVDADRVGLTQHLKSADFFDVGKFPTARFSTRAIEAIADEANRYELKGEMRLHGVTKTLTFPATITIDPQRVLGTASLDISAKAFGIDYEGMEAELAQDDVSLEVELSFPRIAAPR